VAFFEWKPICAGFLSLVIILWGVWYLTPLSSIFQLYRGQFYWSKKPEFPEKTTDLSHVMGKLLSHNVLSSTPVASCYYMYFHWRSNYQEHKFIGSENTMYMVVVIIWTIYTQFQFSRLTTRFSDNMRSFWVEANMCRFFIVSLYLYFRLRYS